MASKSPREAKGKGPKRAKRRDGEVPPEEVEAERRPPEERVEAIGEALPSPPPGPSTRTPIRLDLVTSPGPQPHSRAYLESMLFEKVPAGTVIMGEFSIASELLNDLMREVKKHVSSSARGSHTGSKGKLTRSLLVRVINNNEKWSDISQAIDELMGEYNRRKDDHKGRVMQVMSEMFGLKLSFTRQLIHMNLSEADRGVPEGEEGPEDTHNPDTDTDEDHPQGLVQVEVEDDEPGEEEVTAAGGQGGMAVDEPEDVEEEEEEPPGDRRSPGVGIDSEDEELGERSQGVGTESD